MDYLHVELTHDCAQAINDIAEELGCDYGPVLGVLVGTGLLKWAQLTHNATVHAVGAQQFKASCQPRNFSLSRWDSAMRRATFH